MRLVDYHSHSLCSFDSQAPLLDEAEQAVKLGLSELCTTDHCDLLNEDGDRVCELDWDPILAQYHSVRRAFEGRLTILLGLELGSAQADADCGRKILSGAPLDFVIGSVHNLSPQRGGRDLYYLDYSTQEGCYAALDDYFQSMASLAVLTDCYDVLGHIIYPLRYMHPAGAPLSLARYEPVLREIFAAAIQAGKGIELNTWCGRTLSEWLPVLSLYRSCGGEIVTTGSDAHSAGDIGKGAGEAQDLLKEAGFRYFAIYRKRIPQFIRL